MKVFIIELMAFLVGLAIVIAPLYVLYRIVKHLIRYHAETQAYTWDRYTKAREAEKDLNDLEGEINYMKNHDWSKEP